MYDVSFQYWIIVGNSAHANQAKPQRNHRLIAERRRSRRSDFAKTSGKIVEAVFLGLIDGFLAPRLHYTTVNKSA